MNFLLYGLLDPRSKNLRYLGITSRSLAQRFSEHLYPRHMDKTYRANWIHQLRALNMQPIPVPLAEFSNRQDACDAEIWWAAKSKAAGLPMVNTAPGGDIPHMLGRKHTPETRAKIQRALNRPETRKKLSLVSKGKQKGPLSPIIREKISRALRGKPKPLEVVENLRRMNIRISVSEVLRLTQEGISAQEIARLLGASLAHIRRLKRRYGSE